MTDVTKNGFIKQIARNKGVDYESILTNQDEWSIWKNKPIDKKNVKPLEKMDNVIRKLRTILN